MSVHKEEITSTTTKIDLYNGQSFAMSAKWNTQDLDCIRLTECFETRIHLDRSNAKALGEWLIEQSAVMEHMQK